MPLLRQLDALRDRRVSRHALHVQKLRRAESEEIEEIAVEPRDAAADARVEVRVDPRAPAQHAVQQLARPTPITAVEPRGAAVEREVEQLTGAKIRAHVGRGAPRVGHARRGRLAKRVVRHRCIRPDVVRANSENSSSNNARGRPVLICARHVSKIASRPPRCPGRSPTRAATSGASRRLHACNLHGTASPGGAAGDGHALVVDGEDLAQRIRRPRRDAREQATSWLASPDNRTA